MNQQNILLRISQLLSRFSEQVKILNSNSEFSINVHAENILIKILNVIFDCDLKNVNYEENKNYPSIDLRDENKRIAIQVTSTSTLEKVKHTLSQFVSNNLYKDFDQLYIYILTEKRGRYNQEIINRITGGKFEFPSDHVIDKTDLYLMLNKQNDFQKITDVCELLQQQFSDNPTDNKNELDKWVKYYKGLSEYDTYISIHYKYIDFKGFSPKVDNNIVNLDIDKIYVPLKFKLDTANNNKQSYEERIPYEITTALEKFEKIVVLGDPGSGKSTTLKHLAYEICANRALGHILSSYIPIYIKAIDYSKYYSDTGRNLSEYIIDINTQYGPLFLDSLNNNSLLVLFDGLDEINVTHQRHCVVEKLNSFIAQYPNIKIVVTSRIVGYKETRLSGYFFEFEVDKFSDEQIQAFLNNWYCSVSSHTDNDEQIALASAKDLFLSIKQNNSVYRLACNPLSITIIALIYSKGRKLPEKKASLYDIATSTFLDNWVHLRTTPNNNIDRDTLIELLAPISFYIHEKYSSGLIPESELRQLLINEYKCIHHYLQPKEIKKDINDIISFLRQDAGFLYEKGLDENGEALFGFVHLSFQEYFAAIEFKNKWDSNDETFVLSEYVFNSNWTEVIKLTASLFKLNEPRAGRKKATKFITDILNIDEMIPELNRPLDIICEILTEDVDIEFEVFIKIIDMISNTLSVNERSGFWPGEWYISKLLYTTNYQDYLLGWLMDNISSDPSSILSKRSINILMNVSDIPAVKVKLLSILESGQAEIKKQMFDYKVIWPVADIVKTDVFRTEILKYINSTEYSSIYKGHLPSQYNLCFKDNDSFGDDDFSDDEVLDDWLLSIRLITNTKMKEDLIDFYVFSWGTGDVIFLRKYYEAVKKEYPDFRFEKIKSRIDKLDKYEFYGIDKYPIASFNDIKIFEKKGEESTYVIIKNEEATFVNYPFDNESFEQFFGTQAAAIVDFLNIIIAANLSETKELLIHNDSELDTVINYWNHIDRFFHLNVNKAINYAFSVLFNDGVANEKYLNWLTRVINGNHRPIIIESSLNIDELEQRIKSSSINIFDKLLLLKTIKPDFNDKVLLSIAITEFKEEKSPSKKEDYLSILRRII